MYVQLAMSLRLIDLMMEAVRTSETSVNSHQSTRGYNQNTAIFIVTAVGT
jgi:hypothetical protein